MVVPYTKELSGIQSHFKEVNAIKNLMVAFMAETTSHRKVE